MPIFRKRSTFALPRTLPRTGFVGIVLILLVLAAIVTVVVVSVSDVRPPVRTIEQEIPRERFSR